MLHKIVSSVDRNIDDIMFINNLTTFRYIIFVLTLLSLVND